MVTTRNGLISLSAAKLWNSDHSLKFLIPSEEFPFHIERLLSETLMMYKCKESQQVGNIAYNVVHACGCTRSYICFA